MEAAVHSLWLPWTEHTVYSVVNELDSGVQPKKSKTGLSICSNPRCGGVVG